MMQHSTVLVESLSDIERARRMCVLSYIPSSNYSQHVLRKCLHHYHRLLSLFSACMNRPNICRLNISFFRQLHLLKWKTDAVGFRSFRPSLKLQIGLYCHVSFQRTERPQLEWLRKLGQLNNKYECTNGSGTVTVNCELALALAARR